MRVVRNAFVVAICVAASVLSTDPGARFCFGVAAGAHIVSSVASFMAWRRIKGAAS